MGADVGSSVGADVGAAVGSSVGNTVGCAVGCSVGCTVGCTVGCSVGCSGLSHDASGIAIASTIIIAKIRDKNFLFILNSFPPLLRRMKTGIFVQTLHTSIT